MRPYRGSHEPGVDGRDPTTNSNFSTSLTHWVRWHFSPTQKHAHQPHPFAPALLLLERCCSCLQSRRQLCRTCAQCCCDCTQYSRHGGVSAHTSKKVRKKTPILGPLPCHISNVASVVPAVRSAWHIASAVHAQLRTAHGMQAPCTCVQSTQFCCKADR